jgi:hypothetical protein
VISLSIIFFSGHDARIKARFASNVSLYSPPNGTTNA